MVDLDFWRSVKAEDVFGAVAERENLEFVVSTLRELTPDPVWTEKLVAQVQAGHIETRCFISWLAHQIQPRTYLEVGVRRGFSMAMVAARSPEVEILGVDLWVKEYSGVGNPGPRFVQSELAKIGYTRRIHFLSGDSHRTLPAFLCDEGVSMWDRVKRTWRKRQRPSSFDLITIDGDHSLLGAYQDLRDTMPYCALAGAVVFDDIAPDLSALDPVAVAAERGEDPYGWRDLLGVWHAAQQRFQAFRYFQYTEQSPGVGVAIRLH